MAAAQSKFSRELLTQCPELQPLYDEHMNTWGEELLHILMAELTVFTHALHRVHVLTSGELSDQAKKLLIKFLALLEKYVAVDSPNDQIQGAVYLSFLQGFDVDEEFFESFRQLMGPKLLKAWKEQKDADD